MSGFRKERERVKEGRGGREEGKGKCEVSSIPAGTFQCVSYLRVYHCPLKTVKFMKR
tara:strand:- start:402 stop:572 length:171 start_codon:yes stop_codon:yes gene_type:complete